MCGLGLKGCAGEVAVTVDASSKVDIARFRLQSTTTSTRYDFSFEGYLHLR